jgi:hypothetical protein
VWCSEVVIFQSEHRGFVLDQRIAGMRHYWDDPTIAPDTDTITAMTTAFGVDPLDAYALDVGVLPSGQTALVEGVDTLTMSVSRG